MAHDLRIFPDRERLSRAVVTALVAAIRRATGDGRPFGLVLSGGSTPRRVLERLAAPDGVAVDWSRVHFFWGDERYVPRDHPDSNYRMAREALLDHVAVPGQNVHVPPTGSGPVARAAIGYERALRAFFGDELPRFDWVFLGLGEDGHIASLFPGAGAATDVGRWVRPVYDSPKPPPQRVTMTLELLNQAAAIHVVVAGADKAGVLRATLEGPHDPDRYRAQAIAPNDGTLTWWLDEAAAAELETAR